MRIVTVLGVTALMLPLAAAAQNSGTIPVWIASPTFPAAQPRPGERTEYAGETVRQDVRLQAATTRIRLRLTNELGTVPVAFDRVELRQIAADGRLSTPLPVRFSGKDGTVIAPGALTYSDAIDFAAPAFADVAITVHFPDKVAPAAHRFAVRIANGFETPGADAAPMRGPAIISAIETEAPRSGCRRVVVALGDSITEGAGATANNDWPSQFARSITGGRCRTIVVNAGISGNRVLSNGGSPSLLSRFDRDVLALPGVTDIIFVEGINDVRELEASAVDPAVAADALIAGYRQLVARAHSRDIRVIGGTLVPYKGTKNQTGKGLEIVERVNAAIRAGGIFDAVVDFNRAMADTTDPMRLRADWHNGDWLHPNDAGYCAMVKAIPARLFGVSPSAQRLKCP